MKNNKGITLITLVVIIIALLIMASSILVFMFREDGFKSNNTNNNITEIIDNTQIINEQIECEHDWVVTSEYSFIFSGFKTVSKCSKCGKVIR